MQCPGIAQEAHLFNVEGFECWMLAEPREDVAREAQQQVMRDELGQDVDEYLEKQHAKWFKDEAQANEIGVQEVLWTDYA